MNNNIKIQGQKKIWRIFNATILITNILAVAGAIALKFSRNTYVDISNRIFSPDSPLMNSIALDFLMRPAISILLFALMVWLIMKEKRIESFRTRLSINLAVFASMAMYMAMILNLLYSPILKAN